MISPKLFKNLYNLEHKAVKTYDFNLEEYRNFLTLFNDPQKSSGRIIHVAGTNGKGSVSTMIAAILTSAGYKTGLYTSPHIKYVNERISVDGKNISDYFFKKYEKTVYEEILKRGKSYRTYFEALTTLAFLYFRDRKTDFVVLETGLGGRLDSTNAVESDISVITKIALDHTELLGDTLEKIAFEKAGIIKHGHICFVMKQKKSVLNVVKNKSSEMKSRLFIVDCEKYNNVSNNCFEYKGEKYIINQIGGYQRENAVIAINVCNELQIPIKFIKEGISKFKIEGRLDVLSKKPFVIADGSHNPEAIERTLKEVKKLFKSEKLNTISIFMADKDYAESVKILKKYADTVILTMIPFFRCAKLSDYTKIKDVIISDSPEEAFKILKKDKNGIILFIGSFYFVSVAKTIVENEILKTEKKSHLHS